MKDLTALYCSIDDFWKVFEKNWVKHLIENKQNRRGPAPLLSVSEMMTITVMFQQSNFKTFKHFYSYIHQYYYREFPNLIRYLRFIQ